MTADALGVRAAALQLLDGTASWEQIWGKLLVAGFEPEAIGAALEELQERAASGRQNPGIARQIALLGQMAAQEGMVARSAVPALIGRQLQDTLSAEEVAVFAANDDVVAEIQRVLAQIGIAKTHRAEEVSSGIALAICATRGGDRELARAVNRAAVASGVPAIYYHAQGLQVQVGPLTIPKQTACYECYEVRREAALAPWERTLPRTADEGGQMACLLGIDWVTVDIVKFLAGFGEPVSRGRMLFIDYHAGVPEVHTLLRLPRCTVCGSQRRPAVRLWDDE